MTPRTSNELGMSVEGIVALASLPVPVLAVLFWHVRIFSLYRLLGERVGNLGNLGYY